MKKSTDIENYTKRVCSCGCDIFRFYEEDDIIIDLSILKCVRCGSYIFIYTEEERDAKSS